jgi:hypothetical protein
VRDSLVIRITYIDIKTSSRSQRGDDSFTLDQKFINYLPKSKANGTKSYRKQSYVTVVFFFRIEKANFFIEICQHQNSKCNTHTNPVKIQREINTTTASTHTTHLKRQKIFAARQGGLSSIIGSRRGLIEGSTCREQMPSAEAGKNSRQKVREKFKNQPTHTHTHTLNKKALLGKIFAGEFFRTFRCKPASSGNLYFPRRTHTLGHTA